METTEYAYWKIEYISCEGNDRWTLVRTPIDWLESRIPIGSTGDVVSELKNVYQTNNIDFHWDFCDDIF